jgi:hypothetical protein
MLNGRKQEKAGKELRNPGTELEKNEYGNDE